MPPVYYTADYERTWPNSTDWPGVTFEPSGSGYAGSIWAPVRIQGFGGGHEYSGPSGPALGYLGGDSDFFAGSDPYTRAEFTCTFTADIPNLDHLNAYNPEDTGPPELTFTRAEVAAGAVWAYTYTSDGVSRPLDGYSAVEFFLYVDGTLSAPVFMTIHTKVHWTNDPSLIGPPPPPLLTPKWLVDVVGAVRSVIGP